DLAERGRVGLPRADVALLRSLGRPGVGLGGAFPLVVDHEVGAEAAGGDEHEDADHAQRRDPPVGTVLLLGPSRAADADRVDDRVTSAAAAGWRRRAQAAPAGKTVGELARAVAVGEPVDAVQGGELAGAVAPVFGRAVKSAVDRSLDRAVHADLAGRTAPVFPGVVAALLSGELGPYGRLARLVSRSRRRG